MNFIEILQTKNDKKLEETFFKIKHEVQESGAAITKSIFVQVRKTNFKRDNKDMIMLQIVNVSDSVLYDMSRAHADFL